MGDSNGNLQAHTLVWLLKSNGWQCKTLKQEKSGQKYMPDPRYYVRSSSISLADIRYAKRPCHRCESFLTRCSKTLKTLLIEYIASYFFNDSNIYSRKPRKIAEYHAKTNVPTQQEFIFSEYLAGRYPDIVIFFISAHFRYEFNDVQSQAAFCFDIMDRYLPPTTRVIVTTNMKQKFDRPILYRPDLYDERFENNRIINNVQQLLNAKAYDAVEAKLVDPAKRWYAFPSLYDTTNTTDTMYVDKVHRTEGWYQSIARYLLQLNCLS